MESWWSLATAVLGIAAVCAAGLFAVSLRRGKRLGYGVEMDASTSDRQLRTGVWPLEALGLAPAPLNDPSLVLLRIENRGSVTIDARDYVAGDGEEGPIEVRFPGRSVVGAAVASTSDDNVTTNIRDHHQMTLSHGVLRLPSVPMPPSAHYNVLAAVDRVSESHPRSALHSPPEFNGGIRGGSVDGSVRRDGRKRLAVGLVAFLMVLVVAQFSIFVAAG